MREVREVLTPSLDPRHPPFRSRPSAFVGLTLARLSLAESQAHSPPLLRFTQSLPPLNLYVVSCPPDLSSFFHLFHNSMVLHGNLVTIFGHFVQRLKGYCRHYKYDNIHI